MKWLIPPVLFLFCLIGMGLLRWLWPLAAMLPFPYNLLGLVPLLLGLTVGLAGALTFRKRKTNIRPFREADQLVVEGPFRCTRNPMYLGLALVLTGVWLLLRAISPLLALVLFVVVADRWYIAGEEQMLRRKFGPAFDAYCAQVRRWI